MIDGFLGFICFPTTSAWSKVDCPTDDYAKDIYGPCKLPILVKEMYFNNYVLLYQLVSES